MKKIRQFWCYFLNRHDPTCEIEIDKQVGLAIHEHYCTRCGKHLLQQVGIVSVVGDPRLFNGEIQPDEQPQTYLH